MKVLIAEDNALWRRLLVQQLAKDGYEPIETEDGREAWRLLQQPESPRLVILDWLMPELEGIEVCRRVKADYDRPFTYVMMLSGRDTDEDLVAGLDAGADEYLTKPVDPRVLRSRLGAAKRIVEAIPPGPGAYPPIPGYAIERMLGKGAFATVWQAKREAEPSPVALKVLRVDLATADVFERFAREIEVMRQLDHPNIAAVFDSRIDQGVGFYAMELIEGMTLDRFVRKENPTGAAIIRLVADVCDGLHHAHQRGVIHRDLKLSNVMVDQAGHPKLVDFGLCQAMFSPAAGDGWGETMSRARIGSPRFMAPEQLRGQNGQLDRRADIYSAGVVLYLSLLRRYPQRIEAEERDEAIREIGEHKLIPPRELNPKFSRTLEAILLKALAERPEDRYPTAAALADTLRQFVRERGHRPAP